MSPITLVNGRRKWKRYRRITMNNLLLTFMQYFMVPFDSTHNEESMYIYNMLGEFWSLQIQNMSYLHLHGTLPTLQLLPAESFETSLILTLQWRRWAIKMNIEPSANFE